MSDDYAKRLDELADGQFMSMLNAMEVDELLFIARALLAENERLKDQLKSAAHFDVEQYYEDEKPDYDPGRIDGSPRRFGE
jgi:hypothetical protein